jgi:hypothetical protein
VTQQIVFKPEDSKQLNFYQQENINPSDDTQVAAYDPCKSFVCEPVFFFSPPFCGRNNAEVCYCTGHKPLFLAFSPVSATPLLSAFSNVTQDQA